MPNPRFRHGYPHDLFLSYTHTDDQPDSGRQWVSQFMTDLHARIEIVSGHSVDIWRDREKLGAADRFNESIARAIQESAILLVVLSPSYFSSEPCQTERETFYAKIKEENRELAGGKARLVKAVKFRVSLDKYPPDLRGLLEHAFYVQAKGSATIKEMHLVDESQYRSKVDDVAQEIAGLLAALEPEATPDQTKGLVYLAESTSDLDKQRGELLRHLRQLGYDVLPRQPLRLLPARELSTFVSETIRHCAIAIHPVGAYYGFVPEGSNGKSVVQLQLELAQTDARNGDLARIIWVPEGVVAEEDTQKQFLGRLRTDFAGRGFEFFDGRPFGTLTARVEDRLRASARDLAEDSAEGSGVYVVCENVDRDLAKKLRAFLFTQKHQVEWTPLNAGDLSTNEQHEKLLRRNHAHLVLHGETGEAWIQDRIRELANNRRTGRRAPYQAIYLANPRREDKDDILVRDISVLTGYDSTPVGTALEPFLAQLAVS